MSEMLKVVQGFVAEEPETVTTHSGRQFILVKLQGNEKPVALKPGFDGLYPKKGDMIQVEAQEGNYWFFAEHRSLAVTPRPIPTYDFEEKYNWKGRAAELAQPVLMWLSQHDQVTGEDVYEAIKKLAPNSDVRIIGAAFSFLARKGIIHKVGYRKSGRHQSHFHPKEAVWELVKR